MITYFISGHLDLTQAEFEEHYMSKIDTALEQGAYFVIGDARGCDAMAQKYLVTKTNKVSVYHIFQKPRNNSGFLTVQCQGSKCEDKDVAMTLCSQKDIAWVRPGREKSGTANNLKRRKQSPLF